MRILPWLAFTVYFIAGVTTWTIILAIITATAPLSFAQFPAPIASILNLALNNFRLFTVIFILCISVRAYRFTASYQSFLKHSKATEPETARQRRLLHTSDPYAILGLPQDAAHETIKAAYHRLASIYHPDRSRNPNTAEIFNQINAAYNTLTTNQILA
jgi:hypothetical protein